MPLEQVNVKNGLKAKILNPRVKIRYVKIKILYWKIKIIKTYTKSIYKWSHFWTGSHIVSNMLYKDISSGCN